MVCDVSPVTSEDFIIIGCVREADNHGTVQQTFFDFNFGVLPLTSLLCHGNEVNKSVLLSPMVTLYRLPSWANVAFDKVSANYSAET